MPENLDAGLNPLAARYASREMTALFSSQSRHGLWRRLWAGLARAQMELGLPVREDQVLDLEAHLDDIDFRRAADFERELRHDVMAHVKTYGAVAPKAAGIIHLGATSCDITDNADLILHRRALELLAARLETVLHDLGDFAKKHRDRPCLGWTHFQPAQLTTVGKRACLWAQDLLLDLRAVRDFLRDLPFRGLKGATGTQASFLELCGGDHGKVLEMEKRVAARFGFTRVIPVSGQTYTRKLDEQLLGILCGLASSCAKFANDMRLLMHLREIEEPFEEGQIGSSAMAYKRNPMRSERIVSLARFLQAQHAAIASTAANQWLERTLDDSAVRRLVIPQAFMAADALLRLQHNVAAGLVVHPGRIRARLMQELPFMATELILMECVKRGGDRQQAHEAVRQHSMEVRKRLDEGAEKNELLERLVEDPVFSAVPIISAILKLKIIEDSGKMISDAVTDRLDPAHVSAKIRNPKSTAISEGEGIRKILDEMTDWLDPRRYTGAAALQVDAFLQQELAPAIAHARLAGGEPLTV